MTMTMIVELVWAWWELTEFLLWSQVLTEGNRKVLTRGEVQKQCYSAVLTTLKCEHCVGSEHTVNRVNSVNKY